MGICYESLSTGNVPVMSPHVAVPTLSIDNSEFCLGSGSRYIVVELREEEDYDADDKVQVSRALIPLDTGRCR